MTTENDGFDLGEEAPRTSKPKYVELDYKIFLSLKPSDKPFKIRIASKPRNFRSHWQAFKPLGMKSPVRSPAYSYDEKDLDIAWAEGDWMPQKRHSCLIFDRDDENRLKILEAGDSLFEIFGNWYKATKISPASNEGTDWFVWVKKEGNNTTYSATPDVKQSPFTAEENKILANPPIDLNIVVKIKTPEQIKEMWMQLPDDKKYNPKSKYKAGATFSKEAFEKKYGKAAEPTVATAEKKTEQPKPQKEEPKAQTELEVEDSKEDDEIPF